MYVHNSIYIHSGKQIQVRQFCIHIPYVFFYCFKSERGLGSVFICVFLKCMQYVRTKK